MKMNNQELQDANKKANFIEKNAEQYNTDPIFRNMVDNTVYLTTDQIHKSMSAVGTCKTLPPGCGL